MPAPKGKLLTSEVLQTTNAEGYVQGYMVYLTDTTEAALARIYAASRSSAQGIDSTMVELLDRIVLDFVDHYDPLKVSQKPIPPPASSPASPQVGSRAEQHRPVPAPGTQR